MSATADVDLDGDGVVTQAEIVAFTQHLSGNTGHSWEDFGSTSSTPSLTSPPPVVGSIGSSLCECCGICTPSPPPPPPRKDPPSSPPPMPTPPSSPTPDWWPSYCHYVPAENLVHWVGCNRYSPPSPPPTGSKTLGAPPAASHASFAPPVPPAEATVGPPPSPTIGDSSPAASSSSVVVVAGIAGGALVLLLLVLHRIFLLWRKTLPPLQVLPPKTPVDKGVVRDPEAAVEKVEQPKSPKKRLSGNAPCSRRLSRGGSSRSSLGVGVMPAKLVRAWSSGVRPREEVEKREEERLALRNAGNPSLSAGPESLANPLMRAESVEQDATRHSV